MSDDKVLEYYKTPSDQQFILNSMRKYVTQRQQLDLLLERLIDRYLNDPGLEILDVCCGIGHVVYFLSERRPQLRFTGVDREPYLIAEARSLCKDRPNVAFLLQDAYELAKTHPKAFDVTISWKTLSWLPHYEQMLQTLMTVTRRHIFLCSLFFDGDIDFEIKVREYAKAAGKADYNSYYNIYSLPRFMERARSLGARDVHVTDFQIDVDIPKPPPDQMGTYTLGLADGPRLQISGAIVMMWKVIRIDL